MPSKTIVGVDYTCYTDSVYIKVTALYIWMDAYCFLSVKQFFQLHNFVTWKSQQSHKGIGVIKIPVNDQNLLQLTYLLAVQLPLSWDGQLTLETFLIFENLWKWTQYIFTRWLFRQFLSYQFNIKIINYRGSILINKPEFNNANRKNPHSYSNSEKIYKRLFLWWKDFEQKMFKIFKFCEFIIYYIFISEGAAFLMH